MKNRKNTNNQNNYLGGIRTVSLPASACLQVTSLKHEELIQDDTMIVIMSNFGFWICQKFVFSLQLEWVTFFSDSRAEQCSLDNGVHLCCYETHYHRRSHLHQHLPKPKWCTFFDEDGDGPFDYRGGDYGEKTMGTNALLLIFFCNASTDSKSSVW